MEELKTGLITKATGGFYYVACGGREYECRARGLFRKTGISPLVGDAVKIEVTGEKEGYVVEILPRKNSLVRECKYVCDCSQYKRSGPKSAGNR